MKGKRTSKYKSIVGEEKSNKFTNINLVSEVTEGKLIACNGSFIAASWNSTAGSVAILNTHFPSNVKFNCPVLRGHKYSVFDLEFSPLKDTLLATASDDATVKLWDIPPEGLTENMNQDILTYKGHTRRVSFVKFNPVAADVIASASTDYTLQVWNLVKGETYSQVEFGDLPTSLDWNPIGSLVGVTNKKKTINIFDPREKKSVLVTQIYESPKSPKFTWVGENTFVTTGFSKQNVKELKLWDIRKVTEDLKSEGPVQKLVIDNLTTTIATPFYDHESKLLFTSGKGELTIHCYDLNDSIIYPNADFIDQNRIKTDNNPYEPSKFPDNKKSQHANYPNILGNLDVKCATGIIYTIGEEDNNFHTYPTEDSNSVLAKSSSFCALLAGVESKSDTP